MKKVACLLLAVSLLLSGMPAWAEEAETVIPVTEEETEPQETPAPQETPEATPTVAPSETPPQVEETQPPEASETPLPQNTQTPSATPEPLWDEAWRYEGEGQTIVCGKLYDFVQALEQETEIYLRTDEVVCLEKVNVQKFLLARLLLDEQYFTEGEWILCVSEDDPLTCESPAAFDPETYLEALPEDELTVYVWAALLPEETETPAPEESETPLPDESETSAPSETPVPGEGETPAPSETPVPGEGETPAPEPSSTPDPSAVVLTVEAQDYAADTWSGLMPVFRLSGIPEEKQDYSYAVVVYDKGITILSGDTYEPAEQGEYTVRLAILDEMGDVVSSSENYLLKLDFTLPQLMVEIDMETAYTAHLTAMDGESGLAGFSLDGGETWQELPEEGVYTLSAAEKTVIPAGMIQAKDLAGNVTVWEEEVVLERISYGGGGGGGGDGKKPTPHAPSTTKSDANYNAVGLELSEEPMHTLIMEGEELELTLDVTAAEGLTLPEDYEAQFALSLDSWARRVTDEEGNESIVIDEEHPDVLVLSALIDGESEKYTLRWTFNGAALRTLYNSGIDYLALRAGEDWTVLPTQGFLDGTKYAELKMNGVSTRRFDFTLCMEVDHTPQEADEAQTSAQETERAPWQFTDSCRLTLETRVEGEEWTLLDGKPEMFAQNVYCGPEEMLEVPYGEYTIEEEMK